MSFSEYFQGIRTRYLGFFRRYGERAASRPHREALVCPVCQSFLERCEHLGQEVDLCAGCGGFWCEPEGWDFEGDGSPLEEVKTRHAPHHCPEGCGPIRRFRAPEFPKLEIDRCDVCCGVWFDQTEWESVAAFRRWARHRTLAGSPGTWAEWLFQLICSLPVEFNVRPRRDPVITKSIIVLCLFLFLGIAFDQSEYWLRGLALSSEGLWTGEYYRLFTYLFAHAGLVHLLGNLYFLYVLGDNVEDVLGRFQFLLFFLVTGAASGWAQTVVAPGAPLVGASGAIAAVMGAYVVLFPYARLTFMVIIAQFKLPVAAWLAIWIVIQAVGYYGDPSGARSGVGWIAHLSGFVIGALISLPFRRYWIRNSPLLSLLHSRGVQARA